MTTTIEKRGRKAFVEEHFNEFLQSNQKVMKSVSDISEAYCIYSRWSSNKERAMSESSFMRLYKLASMERKVPTYTTRTISTATMTLIEQFYALERYINIMVDGNLNAIHLYGMPGIGKSETVRQTLRRRGREGETFEFYSGGVKDAYSLAKILYDNSEGKVIVLDDIDSVLRNKTCVEILKCALQDHKERTVTWADSTKRTREETVPTRFRFTSSVIFISNSAKLDKALKNRSKIVHLSATKDECLEWVKSHFNTFCSGIPMEDKMAVYEFVRANLAKFHSMDYRSFKSVLLDYLAFKNDPSCPGDYWKKVVAFQNSGA